MPSPAPVSSARVSPGSRRNLWAGLAGAGASGVVFYTLAASFGVHVALVAAFAWPPPSDRPKPMRYIEVEAAALLPAEAAAQPPLPAALAATKPAARAAPPVQVAKPPPRAVAAAPVAAGPAAPAAPAVAAPAADAAPEPVETAAAASATATSPVTARASLEPAAAPATIYAEGDVDRAPALLGAPRPPYPAAALRNGSEGDVALSLVVDPSGSVTDARITRRAGQGFDAAALAAARKLRFSPGRKGGSAVSVRVTWTCRFRLEN
jgi:periplasmic protein TonB